MAADSDGTFWHWVYLASGGVGLILSLRKIDSSLAHGALEFSSDKYGFAFFGTQAAIMHGAFIVAYAVMVLIGLRGLRRGGRSGA